jgi:hypothetical protein
MWLPDPIYRALPGAYTLSGVAALWAVPPPAGFISGGLLMTAGFAVWRMRQQAQQRPAARHAAVQTSPRRPRGRPR